MVAVDDHTSYQLSFRQDLAAIGLATIHHSQYTQPPLDILSHYQAPLAPVPLTLQCERHYKPGFSHDEPLLSILQHS